MATATTETPDVVKNFVETILEKDKDIDTLQMDRYGFGAWSISKLKVLNKCPFQFYLKYILKIKVPEEVGGRQDSMSAEVGSAVHLVLEHVMRGKNVFDSFVLAKKDFVPKKLSEEQWEEKVQSTELNIHSFKERMDSFGRRHSVKRIFPEMRIGVTRDWEPTGFFSDDVWLRGIIDLVLQLDNGDILIIDHKNIANGTVMSLRPYEEQLDSYKSMFHRGVTPVKGAQAGIHAVTAGDIKLGQWSSKDDIENKLVQSLQWSMDGAVGHVQELGFFKHIRGPHCKWCEYDSMCKPGLLKPLELSTKRVIPITQVQV